MTVDKTTGLVIETNSMHIVHFSSFILSLYGIKVAWILIICPKSYYHDRLNISIINKISFIQIVKGCEKFK